MSGAALHDPARHKDRRGPSNTRPVGEPYPTMTEAEIGYWRELVNELPWLHSGHRILLRMACRLSARLDEGEVGVSATQVLSSLLSKLGATPVDETKVNHQDGDEEDPTDRFFERWSQ